MSAQLRVINKCFVCVLLRTYKVMVIEGHYYFFISGTNDDSDVIFITLYIETFQNHVARKAPAAMANATHKTDDSSLVAENKFRDVLTRLLCVVGHFFMTGDPSEAPLPVGRKTEANRRVPNTVTTTGEPCPVDRCPHCIDASISLWFCLPAHLMILAF